MSWSNRCIVFCGVGFGSGLLPKAPGTFGSAFALLFIPAVLTIARLGLPVGYDSKIIAANNLKLLHEFPEPGVPLVVIDGQVVNDEEWLSRLPS